MQVPVKYIVFKHSHLYKCDVTLTQLRMLVDLVLNWNSHHVSVTSLNEKGARVLKISTNRQKGHTYKVQIPVKYGVFKHSHHASVTYP